MSFDLSSSSSALSRAVSYANKAGVVLVAAAGNQNTNARVYPAAPERLCHGRRVDDGLGQPVLLLKLWLF